MEKISRILPSSNRFKISDDSDNFPGRPGAQMLGREVGANDIRDRVTRSSAAAGKMGFEEFSPYKEPKEAARTRIAEDIAKRFFIEKDMVTPRMEPETIEAESSPNILVLPVMVIPSPTGDQIRSRVETPSLETSEFEVSPQLEKYEAQSFEPSTEYAIDQEA
ncbi:MAG: hypothetical protein AB7O96_03825 [Pseudobdellovibrionaceae bacterium]